MEIICVLGTPGAGKTTEAELLAKYLDCPWFSMGELIRAKATGQDRQDMLDGKIIDDTVTMRLVDDAIASVEPNAKQCIFEGNPRRIPQVDWWLAQVKSGRIKIKGIIHLSADPAIAADRLNKRGRVDDASDHIVEKRLAEYKRFITPTLDYLKQHNIPIQELNANGTIEEVADQIHKALGL